MEGILSEGYNSSFVINYLDLACKTEHCLTLSSVWRKRNQRYAQPDVECSNVNHHSSCLYPRRHSGVAYLELIRAKRLRI